MSIWYEVFIGGITPIEVEKVTEKCVWVNGRRRLRTGWRDFYPTWDEAKSEVVKDAERKVEYSKVNLARAISALDVARKMTNGSAAQRESKA